MTLRSEQRHQVEEELKNKQFPRICSVGYSYDPFVSLLLVNPDFALTPPLVRIKHKKVPIKTVCSLARCTQFLTKQGHPSRYLRLFSSLHLSFLRFETATANVKELHGVSRSIE